MPFSKDLLIGSSGNQGAGEFYEYQITRSLRVPGDADNQSGLAFLSRTQPSGAAADGTKETVSFWFKNGFAPPDSNPNQDGVIMTHYDGTSAYEPIKINHYADPYSNFMVNSKGSYHVFDTKSSDVSGWSHFVMVVNTSDSTAGDRHKFYINGTRITDFLTETTATSGATMESGTYAYNSSNATIKVAGNAAGAAGFFTGYLAEFVYVSDNNYDISNFGETKSGVWVPKDVSGLTFGAKGFYLKFIDSNFATDSAGVGNFSATNLVARDSVKDTPTFDSEGQPGNFCTLNPHAQQGGADSTQKDFAQGNLFATDHRYFDASVMATMGFNTGKWYYEGMVSSSSLSGAIFGWCNSRYNIDSALAYNTPSSDTGAIVGGLYADNTGGGAMRTFSAIGDGTHGSNTEYTTTFARYDIIGVAFDVDNGKMWFSVNGSFTDIKASANPATAVNPSIASTGGIGAWSPTYNTRHRFFPAVGNWSAAARDINLNFGADSSFAGNKSTGSNNAADANGYGDFYYTPPDGFLAMCSANLPDPATAVDPSKSKNGTFHCDSGLYSGTGTAQNITGLNFQPDLVWVSQRTTNTTANNYVFDSTRGVNKYVITNSDAAQSTDADTLTAFNSDGFSIGSDANTNSSTDTYHFLAWKANGGTTSTNTDGTVASTVQANDDVGFSIVKYTGTGSSMTVGHGLSSQPDLVIVKDIDATVNWIVYSKDYDNSNDYAFLNTNAAWSNSGLTGAGTSVITFDSASSYSNTSSRDYIMYCWREIEGYSKFGFYSGNAADDGPTVFTGFRPQGVIVKKKDGSDDWGLYTQGINPTGNVKETQLIRLDSTNGQQGGTGRKLDFMSCGFKLYTSNSTFNADDEYFYAAWGDIPFKYGSTYI